MPSARARPCHDKQCGRTLRWAWASIHGYLCRAARPLSASRSYRNDSFDPSLPGSRSTPTHAPLFSVANGPSRTRARSRRHPLEARCASSVIFYYWLMDLSRSIIVYFVITRYFITCYFEALRASRRGHRVALGARRSAGGACCRFRSRAYHDHTQHHPRSIGHCAARGSAAMDEKPAAPRRRSFPD